MSEQVNLFDKKYYKKNTKTIKERNIQLSLCEYLKKNYPSVIFMCDLASGMNLGKWIGGMNARMRSSRAQPDLFIASTKKSQHHISHAGLFIEIKKDSVYKKDGTLKSQKIKDKKTGKYYDHLEEQDIVLQQLRKQGYVAEFGCGELECKKIIDEYFKNEQ